MAVFADTLSHLWTCMSTRTVLPKHELYPEHLAQMGWSPQLVMSYTGHEDYDSMKPYIALTDKTRKKMMETNF